MIISLEGISPACYNIIACICIDTIHYFVTHSLKPTHPRQPLVDGLNFVYLIGNLNKWAPYIVCGLYIQGSVVFVAAFKTDLPSGYQQVSL
jgi:hypothetical protein